MSERCSAKLDAQAERLERLAEKKAAASTPSPRKKYPFDGHVLRLDKLKGIEPGGWGLDWKAGLNRMVVLVVGMTPKDESEPFDLDAAMAELGYVKKGGER